MKVHIICCIIALAVCISAVSVTSSDSSVTHSKSGKASFSAHGQSLSSLKFDAATGFFKKQDPHSHKHSHGHPHDKTSSPISAPLLFPLGLSNGPPVNSQDPAGVDALSAVKAAGITFLRSGMQFWSNDTSDKLATQMQWLSDVGERGLYGWIWLGTAANLPHSSQAVLTQLIQTMQTAPNLLAWKGQDEPLNGHVGPKGLINAYQLIKSLDPQHPVVLIQAPRGNLSALETYRPGYDVTGCDIFPLAYPPGRHSDLPNHDISVVGDVTNRIATSAQGKPVWMTLQIAWSGILPHLSHQAVPRFPNQLQERFMAYDAVFHGAKGLSFFGGHLTAVTNPTDAALGWNWAFWNSVLKPLIEELSSNDVQEMLTSPVVSGTQAVQLADPSSNPNIRLQTKLSNDGAHLFVLAMCVGGNDTALVTFTNTPEQLATETIEILNEWVGYPLPKKMCRPNSASEVVDGAECEQWVDVALGEEVDELYAFKNVAYAAPPAVNATQQYRRLVVDDEGNFSDWFAPYDVHIYRFNLTSTQ